MRNNSRIILTLVALAIATLAASCRNARAQNYDYIATPLIALSNTAQSAKAAPGTMLYYACVNPNATLVWLQLFDTIGSVTVGTTPPTISVQIPPASATGAVSPKPNGAAYYFTAGIQAAITTTQSGGTAPASPVPCDIGHR